MPGFLTELCSVQSLDRILHCSEMLNIHFNCQCNFNTVDSWVENFFYLFEFFTLGYSD